MTNPRLGLALASCSTMSTMPFALALRPLPVVTLALALALGLASACAKPPLDSYDNTCTATEDCVLVSTSESCDCRCGDFPINRDEVERFRREQDPFCPLPSTVECLCVVVPVDCVDGQCAIQNEP